MHWHTCGTVVDVPGEYLLFLLRASPPAGLTTRNMLEEWFMLHAILGSENDMGGML